MEGLYTVCVIEASNLLKEDRIGIKVLYGQTLHG